MGFFERSGNRILRCQVREFGAEPASSIIFNELSRKIAYPLQ
jgi:hypothetical protein